MTPDEIQTEIEFAMKKAREAVTEHAPGKRFLFVADPVTEGPHGEPARDLLICVDGEEVASVTYSFPMTRRELDEICAGCNALAGALQDCAMTPEEVEHEARELVAHFRGVFPGKRIVFVKMEHPEGLEPPRLGVIPEGTANDEDIFFHCPMIDMDVMKAANRLVRLSADVAEEIIREFKGAPTT
jgi:hypothetical protein